MRRAFILRLKPGAFKTYRRHHAAVWPELREEIENCGFTRMTIFAEDPLLVIYTEFSDVAAWDRLLESDVQQRWGKLMATLVDPSDAGVQTAVAMEEIFNLRAPGGA